MMQTEDGHQAVRLCQPSFAAAERQPYRSLVCVSALLLARRVVNDGFQTYLIPADTSTQGNS
jgi:hypothetical protein